MAVLFILCVSPYILHYLCLPGFFQFSETLALLSNHQRKMCHTEGEAGACGAGPAIHLSSPRLSQLIQMPCGKGSSQLCTRWEPAGQGKLLLPSLQPFVTPHLRGWFYPWGSLPQDTDGASWWVSKESGEGIVVALETQYPRGLSWGLCYWTPGGGNGVLDPLVSWWHQTGGTEAGVQVAFRNLGRTGRPPRLPLGLVPNTAETHSRLCGERRLVVQGEFLRPGKMARVSFWMGKGHLHQPYFIVDSAQEVGLNYQKWAGRHHEATFHRPGVCKPGLATFPVSWRQPSRAMGQLPCSHFSALPGLCALVKWAEKFNS